MSLNSVLQDGRQTAMLVYILKRRKHLDVRNFPETDTGLLRMCGSSKLNRLWKELTSVPRTELDERKYLLLMFYNQYYHEWPRLVSRFFRNFDNVEHSNLWMYLMIIPTHTRQHVLENAMIYFPTSLISNLESYYSRFSKGTLLPVFLPAAKQLHANLVGIDKEVMKTQLVTAGLGQLPTGHLSLLDYLKLAMYVKCVNNFVDFFHDDPTLFTGPGVAVGTPPLPATPLPQPPPPPPQQPVLQATGPAASGPVASRPVAAAPLVPLPRLGRIAAAVRLADAAARASIGAVGTVAGAAGSVVGAAASVAGAAGTVAGAAGSAITTRMASLLRTAFRRPASVSALQPADLSRQDAAALVTGMVDDGAAGGAGDVDADVSDSDDEGVYAEPLHMSAAAASSTSIQGASARRPGAGGIVPSPAPTPITVPSPRPSQVGTWEEALIEESPDSPPRAAAAPSRTAAAPSRTGPALSRPATGVRPASHSQSTMRPPPPQTGWPAPPRPSSTGLLDPDRLAATGGTISPRLDPGVLPRTREPSGFYDPEAEAVGHVNADDVHPGVLPGALFKTSSDDVSGHVEDPADMGISEITLDVVNGEAEIDPSLQAECHESHGLGSQTNVLEFCVGKSHGSELLGSCLQSNDISQISMQVVDRMSGPLDKVNGVSGLTSCMEDPHSNVRLNSLELLGGNLPLHESVKIDELVLFDVSPIESGFQLSSPTVDSSTLSRSQPDKHLENPNNLYSEILISKRDHCIRDGIRDLRKLDRGELFLDFQLEK